MGKIRYMLAGFVLLAFPLLSQQPDFHYFDPKSLVSIQGTVQRIDLREIYNRKSQFLVLTILDPDNKVSQVEVCPQWFIENDIAVGMKIQIRGSLLSGAEADAYLIAQEISLHGERIVLRDRRGFPLWSQPGGQDGKGNRKGAARRGKR